MALALLPGALLERTAEFPENLLKAFLPDAELPRPRHGVLMVLKRKSDETREGRTLTIHCWMGKDLPCVMDLLRVW